MKYLSVDSILRIHAELIRKYGGSNGVRNRGLIESALRRPRTSAFGKDAYPSIHDKAAAVCHSFLFNHAFVDGNKRTAFAACHLTLLANGYELTATSETIYRFLISVIKTHKHWKFISSWLKKNSKKTS